MTGSGSIEPIPAGTPRGTSAVFLAILEWCVFAIQAVALGIVAARNFFALNPDAMSYFRIAKYYAEGRFGLAVNGYWSPMLSWMMTPLVATDVGALTALRVAMMLSALVFTAGYDFLLRTVVADRALRVLLLALLAVATLAWSVENITPDLLADGIVLFALASTLRAVRSGSSGIGFGAGALWGAAYLAKAVNLPVALGSLPLLVLLIHAEDGDRSRSRQARLLLFAGAGLAAVALPWIVTLSILYQRPTFSTAGRIAHAIVGPTDRDRRLPMFVNFVTPPQGRITIWEEPSRSPFAYWSPFESSAYFRHQVNLFRSNAALIWKTLASFDLLGFGLTAGLASLFALLVRPSIERKFPWIVSIVPFPLVCLIYAQVFAVDSRYYYVVWPLLLLCAVEWGRVAGMRLFGRRGA
ncbi:MAG: hypothetical protein WBX15_01600, partial [Thermoanaerobaculia bacterium]